eukprot:Opistho-2@44207
MAIQKTKVREREESNNGRIQRQVQYCMHDRRKPCRETPQRSHRRAYCSILAQKERTKAAPDTDSASHGSEETMRAYADVSRAYPEHASMDAAKAGSNCCARGAEAPSKMCTSEAMRPKG